MDRNMWKCEKAMAVRDRLLSFSFPPSDPLYFLFSMEFPVRRLGDVTS